MEREFLLGVDFRLFVDEATYESWLNLLRGLVYAKEREAQRWQAVVGAVARPLDVAVSGRREYAYAARSSRRVRHARSDSAAYGYAAAPPRARSSSPQASSYAYPFTFSVPQPQSAKCDMSRTAIQPTVSPSTSPSRDTILARPGSKRSAEDAFSPTSATFAAVPLKRPTGLAVDTSMSGSLGAMASGLVVPAGGSPAVTRSAYPSTQYADSLKGLENLSLSAGTPGSARQRQPLSSVPQQSQQPTHVLAAPYEYDVRGYGDAQRRGAPENLYFYALASSPMRDGYGSRATSGERGGAGGASHERRGQGGDVAMESQSQSWKGATGRKGNLRYSKVPPMQVQPSSTHSHSGSTYPGSVTQTQTQHTSGLPPAAGVGYVGGNGNAQPYLPPLTQALAYGASSSLFQASRDLPLPLPFNLPHPQPHPQAASSPAQYQQQQQQPAPHPLTQSLHLHRAQNAPLVVQSARSSPLPSFADVYASGVGVGVGSGAGGYLGSSAQSQSQARTYGYSGSSNVRYALSPLQHTQSQRTSSSVSQSQPWQHHHHQQPNTAQHAHAHAHEPAPRQPSNAAPAPFANAGPPGIQHFYGLTHSHSHSQTRERGRGERLYTYDGPASSPFAFTGRA